MNAPFYKFGLFGDEASFILAFVIGIGFGFFLERAGFGSATQARGPVLSSRPERSQGDVHRHHHRHDRPLLSVPPGHGGPVAGLPGADVSWCRRLSAAFFSVLASSLAGIVRAPRASPPLPVASTAWSMSPGMVAGLFGFAKSIHLWRASLIPRRWGRSRCRSSSTFPMACWFSRPCSWLWAHLWLLSGRRKSLAANSPMPTAR